MTEQTFNTTVESEGTTDQTGTQGTSFIQEGTPQTGNTSYSVGDKNFNDLDSLKNSYSHGQNHIQTLESERSTDRDRITVLESQLEQSKKIEEVLERIQNGQTNTDNQTGLNVDDIVNKAKEAVNADLAASRTLETQAANWADVTSKLVAKYGDKTDDTVKQMCTDNEMTWEEAVGLAQSKPKAFLRLLGVGETKVNNTPTTGGSNTASLLSTNKAPEVKNIMELRSGKDRADYFLERLQAAEAELGS